MIKKIFIVLLVVFVVIQFIRPAKNISTAAEPKAIGKVYAVPANVEQIMEKACYDCHSNNTRYPWYNNIQPVAWWLQNHVKDGKDQLNFSEFGSYPLAKQAKKLRKVAREVKDGGMPLNYYLWIHKDAILTPEENSAVVTWASNLSQQIATDNHIDMTEKKKDN